MANTGVVVVVSAQDDTGAVLRAIDQNMAKLRESAAETESAFGKLGERIVSSLEYMGIYLGARELVDGFKEAINRSLEFGEAIERAGKQTGLSAQSLSVMHYAATTMGGDFDTMVTAVSKMEKTINEANEGNKKASAYIRALGLDAQKLAKDLNGPETAFRALATLMAQTNNSQERNNLATGLLGSKAGAAQIADLISLGTQWDELTEKAKANGTYLDGDGAKSLEETNAKLKDMQDKVLGASVSLTEGLSPGLAHFFDILSDGKGSQEAFKEWGQFMGKMLNGLAATVYGLASGMETLLSLGEHVAGNFGLAAVDMQAAKDLGDKAAKFRDANGKGPDKKEPEKTVPADPTAEARIKKLIDDLRKASGGAALASGKGDELANAQRELAQAQDKLEAAKVKAASEEQLALLEDRHKQQLVSDEDFYRQKAALQQAALAAEADALTKQQNELQSQIDRLGGQKLKGPEATGRDAKVTELRAKQVELQTQSVALGAKEAANAEKLNAELAEAVLKRRDETDALNAASEVAYGTGTAARVKQSNDAYYGDGGERQKIALERPEDLTTADTVQQHKEDEIEASGADQGAQQASGLLNMQRSNVDAQASRGLISAQEAQRRKIELDKEEADAMQPVLAAYQKLAQSGDLNAAEKVAELQEKILELKNPVDEVAAHVREELGSAFEGVFENIDQGTKALESFVKELERTAEKAAYDKLIKPGIDNLLGKVIPDQRGGANAGNEALKGLGDIFRRHGDAQPMDEHYTPPPETPVASEVKPPVPAPVIAEVVKPLAQAQPFGGFNPFSQTPAFDDAKPLPQPPALGEVNPLPPLPAFDGFNPAAAKGPLASLDELFAHGAPDQVAASVPADVAPDAGSSLAKQALGGLGGLLGKFGVPGASAVQSAAQGKGGGGEIIIRLENNSSLPLDIGGTDTKGSIDKDQVLAVVQNSYDEGGLMRQLLAGFTG